MKNTTNVTVGALALALGLAGSAQAGTLEDVQARGVLNCVVSTGVAGFAYPDDAGKWHGFDIDFCRATAAAVLGDADAIKAVTSTGKTRFTKLNAGEGDVLWRNTTITFSRDVGVKLRFHGVNYYDGQGFMVQGSLGVKSALELDGASVCIQAGTTTELNLADFSRQNGLNINVVPFEDTDAVVAAYEGGQCDSFTNDRSQLAAIGSAFQNRDDHVILPETISEEPLGPVVPHGDDQWFDIVKTVMSILIYAEAYDVGSGNVPTSATGDAKVDRLFGLEGSFGQDSLGLEADVSQTVIRAVGNYGEIYDRNLGAIGLTREDHDRNALWAAATCTECPTGGQIYAAPLR